MRYLYRSISLPICRRVVSYLKGDERCAVQMYSEYFAYLLFFSPSFSWYGERRLEDVEIFPARIYPGPVGQYAVKDITYT